MVGYTESLTDPSYEGQILVLTYPLIGNYGVPPRVDAATVDDIPLEFESSRIHVAAVVVGSYSEDYSHFLAGSSLGQWLKESGVPAIFGVDTRALTKRIREKGSMLGKILAKRTDVPGSRRASLIPPSAPASRAPSPPGAIASARWREDYHDIPFNDPNQENLVAAVSIKTPRVFKPMGEPKMHPSGSRPLRVLAVDVGMKYNQIRCFTHRGVELKVVPWDYDYLAESEEPFDGLFVSNGPGDPTMVAPTIERLSRAMQEAGRRGRLGRRSRWHFHGPAATIAEFRNNAEDRACAGTCRCRGAGADMVGGSGYCGGGQHVHRREIYFVRTLHPLRHSLQSEA